MINAFSLTELLVVMAVIAILMALLLPGLDRMQERGRRVTCGSNLRQLTVAYMTFAADHNNAVVGANTTVPTDWVVSGNTKASLEKGALYPYVRSRAVYRCPSDVSNHVRTYAISGRLEGEQTQARKLVDIIEPVRTLVFIEEHDPRGYNMGSWIIQKTGANWIDYVPSWHAGGINLSFADGHSEHWIWQDPRTRTINQFGASTPNNPDLKRLQSVYLP